MRNGSRKYPPMKARRQHMHFSNARRLPPIASDIAINRQRAAMPKGNEASVPSTDSKVMTQKHIRATGKLRKLERQKMVANSYLAGPRRAPCSGRPPGDARRGRPCSRWRAGSSPGGSSGAPAPLASSIPSWRGVVVVMRAVVGKAEALAEIKSRGDGGCAAEKVWRWRWGTKSAPVYPSFEECIGAWMGAGGMR